MSQGLIGRKVGMTSVFLEDGTQVPVTVLQLGPCTVLYKRTMEKDKYSAIALGFDDAIRKDKDGAPRITKPEAGQFKKFGQAPMKVVREFRMEPADVAKLEVGTVVKADLFKKGTRVDIAGITKGRGFSGVFKRHHMKGAARDSSTAHELHRHIGAIGQRKTPGRVFKNKRMPGHMGVENRTTQNLTVVDVDVENNLMLVKGGVSGRDQQIVLVFPATKGPIRKVIQQASKAEKKAAAAKK